MPDDTKVAGEDVLLQVHQIAIHQGPSEVYEVAAAAGAGYGDPIECDPEAVCRDVCGGDISMKVTREISRVVRVGEGEELRVDVEAIVALRCEALVERLGREPYGPPAALGCPARHRVPGPRGSRRHIGGGRGRLWPFDDLAFIARVSEHRQSFVLPAASAQSGRWRSDSGPSPMWGLSGGLTGQATGRAAHDERLYVAAGEVLRRFTRPEGARAGEPRAWT